MTLHRAKRNVLLIIVYTLLANAYLLVKEHTVILWLIIPLFLAVNVLIGCSDRVIRRKRLKLCHHGTECLIVFCYATLLSLLIHGVLCFWLLPDRYPELLWSLLWCAVAQWILFWNGIISVYVTSVQLGISMRVVGALCGWIPIVNLIVLLKIIRICREEVAFETHCDIRNEDRHDAQICRTKYPILLVHGVFFRDSNLLNYWGRIPSALETNGATIYYGEHQSAASVADSAAELTAKIKYIVAQSGCEKVNIIAHSKGGLDCRCAIANGAAPYIASLTTINTPHRGCGFADYLLDKVPQNIQAKIEQTYNAAAHRLGDRSPDFMAAVHDLTEHNCHAFDRDFTQPEGIYCQSIGSELRHATGGRFPLNFSYHLVKFFDGPNDGLVASDSFQWGDRFIYLTPAGKRGISHADVIDLNRDNIPDFDVREFYVSLVHDLKERGL